MSKQDFTEIVSQYNMAMRDFFKGDPEPINQLYSNSDDVSLAQLSGSFIFGRKQVTETVIRNAGRYRESMDTTFETLAKYQTSELAYIVQAERTRVKVGGSNDISSLALRVTSIFRCEVVSGSFCIVMWIQPCTANCWGKFDFLFFDMCGKDRCGFFVF